MSIEIPKQVLYSGVRLLAGLDASSPFGSITGACRSGEAGVVRLDLRTQGSELDLYATNKEVSVILSEDAARHLSRQAQVIVDRLEHLRVLAKSEKLVEGPYQGGPLMPAPEEAVALSSRSATDLQPVDLRGVPAPSSPPRIVAEGDDLQIRYESDGDTVTLAALGMSALRVWNQPQTEGTHWVHRTRLSAWLASVAHAPSDSSHFIFDFANQRVELIARELVVR